MIMFRWKSGVIGRWRVMWGQLISKMRNGGGVADDQMEYGCGIVGNGELKGRDGC